MHGMEVRKIWDIDDIIKADGGLPEGPRPGGEIHPDLVRFKDYWYCGLKESGQSRIIRSPDGGVWESVKVFRWSAGIVGDLKFSITSEGALMVNTYLANTSISRHQKLPLDPSHPALGPVKFIAATWLTENGVDWGTLHACPSGYHSVRYSTTWHHGMGYSIACLGKDENGTLYRTGDGKAWQVLARDVFASWQGPTRTAPGDPHDIQQSGTMPPFRPSEAALAFDPHDGTAWAVARAHPVFAIIGTSHPPYYKEWTWREARVDWLGDGTTCPASEKLGVQMGGPVLRRLSDGRLIAAGRADASTPTVALGRMTFFLVDAGNSVLKRFGAFDGYSHYPGVVEYDNRLWITCGRQQRPDLFGVYLVKAPLPSPSPQDRL